MLEIAFDGPNLDFVKVLKALRKLTQSRFERRTAPDEMRINKKKLVHLILPSGYNFNIPLREFYFTVCKNVPENQDGEIKPSQQNGRLTASKKRTRPGIR
jgi:hypothetical protein